MQTVPHLIDIHVVAGTCVWTGPRLLALATTLPPPPPRPTAAPRAKVRPRARMDGMRQQYTQTCQLGILWYSEQNGERHGEQERDREIERLRETLNPRWTGPVYKTFTVLK